MVSKNNHAIQMEEAAERQPHFGIRKLTIGVASVLLSTTLWLSGATSSAHAETTDTSSNDENKATDESNTQTQNIDNNTQVVVQMDGSNSSANQKVETNNNENTSSEGLETKADSSAVQSTTKETPESGSTSQSTDRSAQSVSDSSTQNVEQANQENANVNNANSNTAQNKSTESTNHIDSKTNLVSNNKSTSNTNDQNNSAETSIENKDTTDISKTGLTGITAKNVPTINNLPENDVINVNNGKENNEVNVNQISGLRAAQLFISSFMKDQTTGNDGGAVDITTYNPEFNITNGKNYSTYFAGLPDTQFGYQAYKNTANGQTLTLATDKANPGANIYFYVNGRLATTITQGESNPNWSGPTSTVGHTNGNPAYQGGNYNYSRKNTTVPGTAYVYTRVNLSGLDDNSVVNVPSTGAFTVGGNNLAIAWSDGDAIAKSPIVAQHWHSAGGIVPGKAEQTIWYVDADTGKVIASKSSGQLVSGQHYDVSHDDPEKITYDGKTYDLINRNSSGKYDDSVLTDKVKNIRLTTNNGLNITVGDVVDAPLTGIITDSRKGNVAIGITEGGPSRLYISKQLDTGGTITLNTYDMSPSEGTIDADFVKDEYNPNKNKYTNISAKELPSIYTANGDADAATGSGLSSMYFNGRGPGNQDIVFLYHSQKSSEVAQDIKQVVVKRQLTRNIDYKENDTDKTISDPNSDSERSTVAGLPEMDQSKLDSPKTTSQTIDIQGIAYRDTSTGQLIQIKTDDEGNPIDANGNLIATDANGNAVIGQKNADGTITAKLDSSGKTTSTQFVALTDNNGKEEQGGFYWSIPSNEEFKGFNAPKAPNYDVNPGEVPTISHDKILDLVTSTTDIKDALGNTITNPTVKQVLDYLNGQTTSVTTDAITDDPNYPQVPQVGKDKYIFDQFQLTDSYGNNLPYVVTLAVSRKDPSGGVYEYVTNPDYSYVYWSSSDDESNDPLLWFKGNNGAFKIDVHNYSGDDGNSISVNIDPSVNSNYNLRRIFGYGAQSSATSIAWGDIKPRQVTQTISYVDENGNEITGFPPTKVSGLTDQNFKISGANAPKISGYELVRERFGDQDLTNDKLTDTVGGTVSDYEVGQTYTRTWYSPGLGNVKEQQTLLDKNGTMHIKATLPNGQITEDDVAAGKYLRVRIDVGNKRIYYNIQNPWVPSTSNITFVYKKVPLVANPDPYYVVYTPHKATEQSSASLIFHDDTTNTNLQSLPDASGDVDTAINFAGAATDLNNYISGGADAKYKFVSTTEGTTVLTTDSADALSKFGNFEANNSKNFVIHLVHNYKPITPKNPDNPNDPGNSYKGVDLVKKVTRNVNYIVADGGVEAPDPENQSETFVANGYEDLATGKLCNVSDGKVTDDNGSFTWTVEGGNTDQGNWAEIPYKEVKGYHISNITPSDEAENQTDIKNSGIKEESINHNSSDKDVTVIYVKDQAPTPTYHNGTEETKVIHRTINYYDKITGQKIPSDLIPTNPYTDSVTFTRMPILDENNKTVGYGTLSADGKSYTFQDWNIDGQDSTTLKDVTSPTLKNYTSPDVSVVRGVKVTGDSSDLVYNVYYGHQTQAVPITKDVKRNFNYIFTDGTKPSDHSDLNPQDTQTATFTGTATKDLVTGQTSPTTWTSSTASLAQVDAHPVDGYKIISAINGTMDGGAASLSVNPNSPDTTVTIIYSPVEPKKQNASVQIIDKTNNNTVLSNFSNDTGIAGNDISFDGEPQALTDYINNGYKFDSAVDEKGTSIGSSVGSIDFGQFDNVDGNDQSFKIYLVHGTTTKTETGTNTATVHYIVSDGKVSAPADNKQTVNWTRTDTIDNVTGKVTPGEWKPDKEIYDKVTTPDLTGYTPDKTQIDEITPVYGENPYDVVVYTPNGKTLPDLQNARVQIIDKTDNNKTLTTFNNNKGVAGSTIGFDGEPTTLKSYLNAGYEFDSAVDGKGASIGSSDDSIDFGTFDNVKGNTQNFKIYLIHGKNTVTTTDTDTATVHYIVSDGKKTAPADKTETITWTKTDTVDKVTGNVTQGTWTTEKPQYKAEDTPTLEGYTPDKTQIEAITAVHGENPYHVVVYTPNAVQKEEASVKIIDQDTNKTLGTFANNDGIAGEAISFNGEPETVSSLLNGGYQWVSAVNDKGKVSIGNDQNSINFGTFDNDPSVPQTFTITLKHGKKITQEEGTSTAQVHYVIAGNETNKPTAPKDSTLQTINWTRDVTTDQVTGDISYGQWKPSQSTGFTDVDSPDTVTGYTPDQATVRFDTPQVNKDQRVTVVYNPNPKTPDTQRAIVIYRDVNDSNPQELERSKDLTGQAGDAINYDPQSTITKYEKEGYVLVNNGFDPNGTKPNFDNVKEDQTFYIDFKHGIQHVTPTNPGPITTDLTHDVTRTVTYEGAGDKTPATVTDTLHFEGTGYLDKVTHKWTDADGKELTDQSKGITWTIQDGTKDNGSFDTVATKHIDGYTSKVVTEGADDGNGNVKSYNGINHASKDITVQVKYSPVAPTVKQGTIEVTYHDTTDNVDISGYGEPQTKENEGTPFSYDPNKNDLPALENKGYVLDGELPTIPTKYTDSDQHVVINVKHGTRPVDPDHPADPDKPVDPNHKGTPTPSDPNLSKTDLEKDVTRTVKYQYSDGSKAHDDSVQTVNFKGHGVIDLVTGNLVDVDKDGKILDQRGKITWDNASQNFNPVKAIDHDGYHVSNVSETGTNAKVTDTAVADETVTPTSQNSTIIITLTKNSETPITAKGTITYTDDTTGNILEKEAFNGNVGEAINYKTSDRIQYYESKGYTVKSDNFTDGNEKFNKDASKNNFEVHLIHSTDTKAVTKTVTRDVTYVYKDGSKAPDPVSQKVTFTGKTTTDKVTGTEKTTWDSNKQTFDATKSIDTTKYQIIDVDERNTSANVDRTNGVVSSEEVTPTSSDSKVVITLDKKTEPIKEQGSIKVTVHDVHTGQDVQGYEVDSGTEKVDTPFSYPTKDNIDKLKKAGYKVLNPDIQIPTKISKGDQHFVIYVDHTVIPVTPGHPGNGLDDKSLTKTVTETVHYEVEGNDVNKPAAPADKKATLTFNGIAYYDSVTKNWTDTQGRELRDADGKPVKNPNITWTAQDGNRFAVVVTPLLEGYTPSVQEGYDDGNKNVKEIDNINQNSQNIVVTVKYTKNQIPVPETQKALVIYQDVNDETHPVDIGQSDQLTGHAGDSIDYSTKEQIDNFEKEGYVLVNNGFDSNGQTPSFDNKDGNVQKFYVTFKHGIEHVTPTNPGTVTTDLTHDVTRTVTYEGAGDKTPATVTDTLHFEGTGYLDKVTGKWTDANGKELTDQSKGITWTIQNGTTDSGNFDTVATKHINGYTSKVVTEGADDGNGNVKSFSGINHTSDNINVVVQYNPVVADKGSLIVQFQDDTDKKPITGVGTDTGSQDVDTPVTYTPNSDIEKLEKEGYVYVSQDKNIPAEIVKGSTVVTIHMKHDLQPITPDNPGHPKDPINPNDPRPKDEQPKYPDGTAKTDLTKQITRTIHYEGADQYTPSDVEQPVTFTAKGVLDKVTGKWVTPLTWSSDQAVKGVSSPKIPGYHVINVDKDSQDKKNVDGKTLSHTDKDYTVTVTYVKDQVPSAETTTGKVVYIDDTDNKPLKTDSLSGKVGSNIDYTTQSKINNYENMGYKLVSNDFTDGEEVFDKDASKNNFEVHLVHDTVPVNSNNPGTPDQPLNPKDPRDPKDQPKYPKGTAETDLTKKVTRTIHYEGADQYTPNDVEQSVTFTAKGVLDKVTGQWVTPLTWSKDQTVKGINSPKIPGYKVVSVDIDTTDNQNVTDKTLSHADGDYTVTVKYAKDQAPTPTKQGTIEVTYHDTTDNVDISGYGSQSKDDEGKSFSYNPNAKDIPALENKGYVLDGELPTIPTKFTDGDQHVVINMKHGTRLVDPDHPANPKDPVDPTHPGTPTPSDPNLSKTDLEKDVTRTVKYQYEDGSQAHSDSVQTVNFKGRGVIDLVTGNLVNVDENGNILDQRGKISWDNDKLDFTDVAAIKHDGYRVLNVSETGTSAKVTDTAVAGETVTPTGQNSTIIITLTKNPEPIKEQGSIKVTVHDVYTGQDVPEYEVDSGTEKVDTPFTYPAQDNIKKLTDAGYKVLNPDIQIPTKISKGDQHFVIYVDHTIIPVTPGHPGNGLDDKTLTKTVTETVHYVVKGDQKAPADKTTDLKFTGTAYYDSVTKKWTDAQGNELKNQDQNITWTAQDGNKFAVVVTPPLDGYTPSVQNGYDDGNKNVKEIDHIDQNSNNITVTVTYTKNQTPTPETQNAVVIYQDVNDEAHPVDIGQSGQLTGQAGSTINYSTEDEIKDFEKEGYVLVTNGFDSNGQAPVFDNKDGNVQKFYVTFKHGIQHVTPTTPGTPGGKINPNDPRPNGPKYPDDTTQSALTHDVTRTVTYEGAGDKTPTTVTDTLHFEGTGYLDKVTGKWTDANGKELTDQSKGITWTVQNGTKDDGNFDTVATKHIDGYTSKVVTEGADDGNGNVKSFSGINHASKDITVEVKYSPVAPVENHKAELTIYINGRSIGSITAQGAKNTAINFNHVSDIVNAYTSNGFKFDHAQDVTNNKEMTGKSYDELNFGNFSDQNNSDQKFAIYLTGNRIPDKVVAKITYYDDTTGRILEDDSFAGKVGDKINYTTADKISDYENKGYKLVSNNFKDGQEIYNKDASKNNFEVHLKHDTDKSLLIYKIINRDITYVYADGSQAAEPVHQTFKFQGIMTRDRVTGIDNVDWNANNYDFEATKPIDTNKYQIVKVDENHTTANVNKTNGVVAGETVTPSSENSTVVITLSPIVEKGSIEVTVHDKKTNQDIPDYAKDSGTQKVGTDFDFDKTTTIQDLENAGYKVLNPNIEIPTKVTKGDQHIVIEVDHNIIPVTPDKPGNGLSKDDLDKTVTETIHYVVNGGDAKAPADKTVDLKFTGTGYYDAVTKKWTDKDGNELKDQTKNITWTAENGDKFAEVDTPKLDGYTSSVSDGYGDSNNNVKEIDNINPNTKNITITVTYNQVTPTKKQGSVTIIIHNDDNNKDIPYYSTGEVDEGSKVQFDHDGVVKDLIKAGYQIVKDVNIPSVVGDSDQVYVIHIAKKQNPEPNPQPTQSPEPQPTQAPNSTPSKPTPTPQPTKPTEPTQPTKPTEPSTPAEPDVPDVPETPRKPHEHKRHVTPSKPSHRTPAPTPTRNTAPRPQNNWSNNVSPHGQGIGSGYNNNVAPHGQTVNGWNGNVGPNGEHVDSNGNIIAPNGQIIGYVDKNGNPHYTALPQTGEDQTDEATAALLGSISAAIGLIGLAGVKKRREDK